MISFKKVTFSLLMTVATVFMMSTAIAEQPASSTALNQAEADAVRSACNAQADFIYTMGKIRDKGDSLESVHSTLTQTMSSQKIDPVKAKQLSTLLDLTYQEKDISPLSLSVYYFNYCRGAATLNLDKAKPIIIDCQKQSINDTELASCLLIKLTKDPMK